jgi:rare lipoprotein A
MIFRYSGLLCLILLLAACSGRGPRYYQDDGPHSSPQIDVSRIKDATPRNEPLAASGNKPYVVFGRRYAPMQSARGYREIGTASWYGKKFHGRLTSSGESYDMYGMSAAHKTLPLPSYVSVRNLANDREVIVRVNDRGPFLHGRLIDLSYAAAYKLDVLKTGTARVEVKAIETGYRPAESVAIGTVDTTPVTSGEPLSAPVSGAPLISSANAAPAKPAPGGVFLQVGSFSSWDNAINLRDRLEAKNIKPVAIATVRVKDTRYFRVRVGPLDNLGVAEGLSSQIKALGIHDSRVILE